VSYKKDSISDQKKVVHFVNMGLRGSIYSVSY